MAGSGTAHLRPADATILRVEHLVVEFPAGRGRAVHAVSDLSFDLAEGETLGLVGESGCGKSTTGRSVLQLAPVTSGHVWFDGTEHAALPGAAIRERRTDLQMVFQDPVSSLNPRRRIGDIVAEPLRVWGPAARAERRELVDRALSDVGIDPDAARDRRRHEFSGGQCQRISIARAIVTRPRLLVCDEPVSALDVSVQAQVLNLLDDLKQTLHLTMLFIAHDLAVVRHVSDRVAVMYMGKLCEIASTDALFGAPAHPYTTLLLQSSPAPDPEAELDRSVSSDDDIPSPIDPPSGCRFRTRCPRADERCAIEEPSIRQIGDDHFVACHHPERHARDSHAPDASAGG